MRVAQQPTQINQSAISYQPANSNIYQPTRVLNVAGAHQTQVQRVVQQPQVIRQVQAQPQVQRVVQVQAQPQVQRVVQQQPVYQQSVIHHVPEPEPVYEAPPQRLSEDHYDPRHFHPVTTTTNQEFTYVGNDGQEVTELRPVTTVSYEPNTYVPHPENAIHEYRSRYH